MGYVTVGEGWPDPRNGPWRLWFDLDLVAGRVECVGFALRQINELEEWPAPENPSAIPLTTSVLRSIPFDTVLRGLTSALVPNIELSIKKATEAADRQELEKLRMLHEKQTRRGGRKPLSPDDLLEVARIYRDALSRRIPPTRAVAEGRGVSRSTAAKQVQKARKAGLLNPTTKGKAGA